MLIKRIYKKISIISIISILCLFFSSCKDDGIEFHFASYKTAEEVNYNIFYDDNYFKNPASEYNNKLASASACLALAGFSSTASTDYENTDKNIKYFFDTLGFNDYLANSYGTSKPTKDSFGVYIANKKIDDFTLIGIGVRGAGYQSEWASNFKLGLNDKFAQGFFEASTIYLDFLKEYINKYDIKGNIKIWTSGYSRGGAVVNISAGRIDDGLVINQNILSDNVNYSKDDIYAYSFEPPAGKICDSLSNEIFEKGINYSNIYSIINLNDPVPFVAPNSFNFIRYGNDLFLPDIITDINYENHINIVKKRLNALPNNSIIGSYLIDTAKDESTIKIFNSKSNYTNFSLYAYLDDFISKFCNAIGNKENYVEYIEHSITELFVLIYANLKPKDSLITLGINLASKVLASDADDIVLYDLQHNLSKIKKDLNVLFHSAIKALGSDIDADEAMNLLDTLLGVIVNILLSEDGFETIRPFVNLDNIKAIGSAHIPELLLTHITSLDDNYVSNNNHELASSFNKLYITTDAEFELIINNQKYVYFDNTEIKSKLVVKELGEGYLIYLPSNVEFKINSESIYSYELYNHNNKYLNDTLISSYR